MLLDIKDVISEEGYSLKIDTVLEQFEFEFAGETYSFAEPIHITGEISNVCGSIEPNMRMTGVLIAACSKCLSPVKYSFDITVSELPEDGKAEISPEFDLTSFAEQILSGEIPGNILCKEDCKGLCPLCGTNLNTGKCDCKEDNYDPRFDVLKKLNLKDEV